MEILGLILLVFLFFWLMGGKKKSYKNRRKQYKHRKSYSSNRKKLKPKINPTSFEPFSGYAHVIDGDTIKIRGMKIRLAGINAPEIAISAQNTDNEILIITTCWPFNTQKPGSERYIVTAEIDK